MTEQKRLVLDANILLRAVFGIRVRNLLETYEDSVNFYTPDICFGDTRRYIPVIAATRHLDPAAGLLVLDQLARFIEIIDQSLYEEHEQSAREGCSHGILKTGQSWQPPCCYIAPFGRKTKIFLAAESQPGPLVMLSCIYATLSSSMRGPELHRLMRHGFDHYLHGHDTLSEFIGRVT